MTEIKNTEFLSNDFDLVQSDVRIFDKKLDTKPTTFMKDAFRRFCKNKSSVAAAIILAILILLAIFVPILSPHNIDNVRTTEKFLAPKLFKAGTGFWDGTAAYYLRSGALPLLAAVIFSGPFVRNLQENFIVRTPKAALTANVVLYGVLLAFSMAAMVNATYSSFLYFQF